MREVVKRVHFSSWSSSIKTHLVSTVQYGQVQLAPLLLSISSELTLEFLQKFLVKNPDTQMVTITVRIQTSDCFMVRPKPL